MRLDATQFVSGRKDSPPLDVICRSGNCGKQACEKYLAAGYTNVVNVEGGTQGWDQAGLPVARGLRCACADGAGF